MECIIPFLLVLTATFFVSNGFDFFVKKVEMCDLNYDYPIKFNISFRKSGKSQILNSASFLSVPLDDSLGFNLTCELLVGEKYVHVYTMNEWRACTKIHKYGGEFMLDLERAAQIIPGMCPIRQGKYHIRNLLLDYNRITLQAFPFGEMRLTSIFINKRNAVISCLVALVYNPVI